MWISPQFKKKTESNLIPAHQRCLKWMWHICGQVGKLTVGKLKEVVCIHHEDTDISIPKEVKGIWV